MAQSFLRGVDDAELDIPLLITFFYNFGVIAALSFASIRLSSLALFAGAVVFVLPSLSSYVLTGGRIIRSGVPASTQAFSFVLGILVMRLGALVQGQPLSFFSAATGAGSYLSILSSLPSEAQLIINIVLAPINENLFLIPFAAGVLYFAVDQLVTALGLEPLDSIVFKSAVASVPVALFFGSLHGAVALSFFFFAALVFFLWSFGRIYERSESGYLLKFVPITILATIGLHIGNNINASGTSLTGFILTLLSSSNQAFQLVGVLSLAYFGLMFGLAAYFVVRKVGEFVG